MKILFLFFLLLNGSAMAAVDCSPKTVEHHPGFLKTHDTAVSNYVFTRMEELGYHIFSNEIKFPTDWIRPMRRGQFKSWNGRKFRVLYFVDLNKLITTNTWNDFGRLLDRCIATNYTQVQVRDLKTNEIIFTDENERFMFDVILAPDIMYP